MRSLILLPLLLGVGTAAASADDARDAKNAAELSKELAGLKPVGTSDCLNDIRQSNSTKAIGPVILYRASRSLVFRNDTTGGCEGVARGDILITVSNSGRLCRGDIARTVDPGSRFPTGSCALGAFTTYKAG